MGLDPFTVLMETGKMALERIWPDPTKRAEELRKLEELRQVGDLKKFEGKIQLLIEQAKTNQIEAKSKSVFVAGWRPAVGWICAIVMAFNYIGVYMLEFAGGFFDGFFVPPRMDMGDLYPVLLGMLGISASRSYDKKNGVQTDKIK